MKNYVEITLLPSIDISPYFLWEKVYQQLHMAFVEIKNADNKIDVGIAFPDYKQDKKSKLGRKLRLFASTGDRLDSLNLKKRLFKLNDYVHVTSIRAVPEKIEGYACFKRIQLKGNNARLARRMVKRKKITYEQALLHFKSREEKMSNLPFINLKSKSTDNRFRLFIKKTDSKNQVDGTFNSYGLSKTATVPWF